MINSHLQFHTQLIKQLSAHIDATPPFSTPPLADEEQHFLAHVNQLTDGGVHFDELTYIGQSVMTSIVLKYPHITPHVPRDLFWYFGGDSLHYLEDTEISAFQQLDENYHTALKENGDANYQELRETLIGSDYFTPYTGHLTH